uniref:Transcription factor 23 n=1 Tax=Falco tinnunculus TaxID=100819 RepID=A0A8C4UCZ1_FALTI
MGCGVGPATTHGCSTATTTRSSRGRRGSGSPARAARHFWGVGAGRTPGPLSAHPGDQENPLAEGQVRSWPSTHGSSGEPHGHACHPLPLTIPASAVGCHRLRAGSAPLSPQGPPGPLCPQNAARERSRVRALRRAFLSLQAALPTVPPGTKLSKLDVLVLATSYIAHLSHVLGCGPPPPVPSRPLHGHPLLHPLKKWPMRSRLYAGPWGGAGPDPPGAATATSSQEHTSLGDSRLARGESPPRPPQCPQPREPLPLLSPHSMGRLCPRVGIGGSSKDGGGGQY